VVRLIFLIYYYAGRLIQRSGVLIDNLEFRIMLANPRIQAGYGIKVVGRPTLKVGKKGKLVIGNRLKMNDGRKNNFIGRDDRCLLRVMEGATLIIGNNVGMSSCAIVAGKKVVLGDNVRIGGGVVIYDTDFHSLQPDERLSEYDPGIKKRDVIIEDNVFIGSHSIILKGVHIGCNAVVGAGSVVTKSIPPNEIWAGNPAKFIKKL
jgi:acetyltransferase-like isoleucine patch superfamily enzyme